MADLLRRAAHPEVDHLLAVGAAIVEASFQLGHRRRQDEDPHEIGAEGIFELLGALPVDVEQDVAAVLERFLDRLLRAAVAMIEDIGPFGEFVVGDQPVELRVVDEMIIDPVDLARAHRPGGGADRHGDRRIDLHQLAADRRFARARGGGKDDQQATAAAVRMLGSWGSIHGRTCRAGGRSVKARQKNGAVQQKCLKLRAALHYCALQQRRFYMVDRHHHQEYRNRHRQDRRSRHDRRSRCRRRPRPRPLRLRRRSRLPSRPARPVPPPPSVASPRKVAGRRQGQQQARRQRRPSASPRRAVAAATTQIERNTPMAYDFTKMFAGFELPGRRPFPDPVRRCRRA